VKSASAITERRVVYNNCCKGGKVFIAPFKEPPEFLRALLDFDGPVRSKAFLEKIRQYNCLFAFTSMGATIDRSVNDGGGPTVFKIVRFRALAKLPAIINNSLLQKTMLTEWFVGNAKYANARSLTYCDFPTEWSWVPENKQWVRRKRSDKIGRVYYVHPSTGELYYLRMLLMIVKGAKCYADVRTYNGVVYESFKDACAARGLLGDDSEWYCAFDEALKWGMGNQLRQLFVTMIIFCGVLDENGFFEKYWTYLAEDIQYRIQCSLHDASYTVPDDELRNMLLDELSIVFSKNGCKILDYALPLKTSYAADSCGNTMISDELSQDCETLIRTSEAMRLQLNEDQKIAFESIVDKVRDGKPGLFFCLRTGWHWKDFSLECFGYIS
jgi:hypothetical protein